MVLAAPVYGTIIHACLFVLVGGVQFWLIDGTEFINTFVCGSAYVGQLPGSVLRLPLQVLFTYVLPATLVVYAPVVQLLGLPSPTFIPSWVGWCGPTLALLVALAATVVWTGGVRHYTGAGG